MILLANLRGGGAIATQPHDQGMAQAMARQGNLSVHDVADKSTRRDTDVPQRKLHAIKKVTSRTSVYLKTVAANISELSLDTALVGLVSLQRV